ncbi:interleukin-18 receptor 1-like [Narcine bancroftii]|uniref:interleukin-18 receptor 1-like n=1 Tax=Narcine bancroftii TaxID=1343680 RepID=UPI0038321309
MEMEELRNWKGILTGDRMGRGVVNVAVGVGGFVEDVCQVFVSRGGNREIQKRESLARDGRREFEVGVEVGSKVDEANDLTMGYELDRCLPYESSTVFALEGEHACLRCKLCNGSSPVDTSDIQTHGFPVSWFKDNPKSGLVERLDKGDRIVVQGPLLGFWPATFTDTGRYFCSLFNGTHNITGPNESLDVTPISEGCYSKEIEYSRDGVIGSSTELYCPHMDVFKNNIEELKWYKDCQENVHTGSSLLFQRLEKENAGHYTCILSIEHFGRQYNVTRTLELTLKAPSVEPTLIYPHEEHIEVTLGERRTINCTIFAGHENYWEVTQTWTFKKSYVTNCKGVEAVCKDSRRETMKENGMYVVRPLVFTQVKKEHLNQRFNCVLRTSDKEMIGYIILQEKGKNNFQQTVKLFTFIIVVLCALAIVGVHFNVQISLCFRDLTGRDETLGDSKEYDAYVLLLKSDVILVNTKEEQQFAFELLPAILEEKFGYHLCIFERDVPPGSASAESILFYINKCRRLIIIINKEYVDVDFGSTYELMAGLHQILVERKIKPILIEYKSINNTKSFPESLQILLKSKRRVKWSGNKSDIKNSFFWKKLRYLMPAKGRQVCTGNQ